jgi:histidinol-phosphate aminotransferase
VRPPRYPAKVWLERLRDRKVLVRWFSAKEVSGYLRITIGTDAEAASLMRAVKKVLKGSR